MSIFVLNSSKINCMNSIDSLIVHFPLEVDVFFIMNVCQIQHLVFSSLFFRFHKSLLVSEGAMMLSISLFLQFDSKLHLDVLSQISLALMHQKPQLIYYSGAYSFNENILSKLHNTLLAQSFFGYIIQPKLFIFRLLV